MNNKQSFTRSITWFFKQQCEETAFPPAGLMPEVIYPDAYHYLVDTECVYTRGSVL